MTLNYQLIRSKRKTVAIHVENGQIEVRAPLRAPQYWIDEFLHKHAAWIQKKLSEKKSPALSICDGAIFSWLGQPLRIKTIDSLLTTTELVDGMLYINGPYLTPTQLQKAFIAWLTEQAQQYMTPRTWAAAKQLGLSEKIKNIRYRITRSSWGYCSRQGIIQFNPLIMMSTPEIIAYLIAHEVAHLQHLNHTSAYWNYLSGIYPDYKNARRQLRYLSKTLHLESLT